MEGEIAGSADENILSTKSWTAYVGPLLGYGIVMLISLSLIISSGILGIATFLAAGGRLVYVMLLLRSYRLYRDDRGIWCFSGVLPWKKGTTGVKWRDLDEALYVTNLSSWLFKSYTISIRHRFTKRAEIELSHMRAGDIVVQSINERHQQLVAASAID